jgi:hypothetical protein
MLYVVVTAAILAVATSAMLRVNAMSSMSASRAEEVARAEAAIDAWMSLVKAQAQNRALLVPSYPTFTIDNILVTGTVTDSSAVLPRTAALSATAVVKDRTYRRSDSVGLPASEVNEPVGLFARFWQTNGTNSWWEWPPKLSDSPVIQRVETQFERSGPTMSFVPDAPSPFVIYEGYIIPPETGTYTFQVSADNCWSLWIWEYNLVDAYYGGFTGSGYDDGPVTRSYSTNLVKDQKTPIRFYMMDYGGSGFLNFKWKKPSDSAFVSIPSTVMRPSNYVGGSRRSFSIPLEAKAIYGTALEDSPYVVSATPIDLQSLGFYPGDRIRLRVVGGWNAWGWPTNRQYILQNVSAVISSTPLIDRNPRAINRIPDAINTGRGQITNAHSDQANDFWADMGWFDGNTWAYQWDHVELTIPPNGRYLFAQNWDSYWADNNIAKLGIYNLVIEKGD